jgi:hypothetical protein
VAQPHYLGGSNLKEVQMVQSKQVRIFVMGFIAAALLFTVMAATTSYGPGPGRYLIKTLESPTAMVVVLDTHTGELRYTGIGGAGGGKLVGSIEMFAEPVE